MSHFTPHQGIGTILNHAGEGEHPYHAHVMPIYQTSTFGASDLDSMAAIFRGEREAFFYTRVANPNAALVARKIAILEGLDLLRESLVPPAVDERVAGELFASGMGAVAAAILARVRSGETLLAQRAMYGGTFRFLTGVAARLGIEIVWVDDLSPEGWESAFRAHPQVALVYAESPINPTMQIVDLRSVADIAHRRRTWLLVDNTFATPFCQRPLSLGADIVVHSTTKYLSGHGAVIGGAVVSPHVDFMRQEVKRVLKSVGASPSPFDAWITNLGLKTFELRMRRHCRNAMAVARFLQAHPKVDGVNYPGLDTHAGHQVAREQMSDFGGMLSFTLKGGFAAAEKLINNLRLPTLVGSLGNVDTLIAHPASMSHSGMPAETRRKMGISDGLVRFSVGIENVQDILADLDQALKGV